MTIGALSRSVGVSERTLRNAFADVHRESPKRYFLNERLRTAVEGPTFDTSNEGRGVEALDAVASRSADGSRLFVKLVNTSAATVSARIELRGAAVAPEAEWHVLAADGLQVRNGFATPDAIRPRREVVRAGPSFELSLPRQSVSVLVVKVDAARSGK